jgi:hypothetical protein
MIYFSSQEKALNLDKHTIYYILGLILQDQYYVSIFPSVQLCMPILLITLFFKYTNTQKLLRFKSNEQEEYGSVTVTVWLKYDFCVVLDMTVLL